jgi:hypothetical protein
MRNELIMQAAECLSEMDTETVLRPGCSYAVLVID